MLDEVLAGKRAVVSGICRAIAIGFQQTGAAVAMIGRKREKLDSALAGLKQRAPQARAFSLDVTNWVQFQGMVTRIEHAAGPVDIVVNSQGIAHIKPAAQMCQMR